MNYTALFQTVVLCLISIIFEAIGSSKPGKQWFENLRQPKYSFPFYAWYFIGGLYYIICGLIAYRLFNNSHDRLFIFSIILLISMMFINGMTNLILFKWRHLLWFYLIIYPFSLVVIVLFVVLLQFDEISAWVLFPYLIWLIYDVYYFRNLWKLNREYYKKNK
jgi:translocator protein